MEESDGRLKAYLAQHPRMMGALFTLMLLLSQVGTAVASTSGGTTPGP